MRRALFAVPLVIAVLGSGCTGGGSSADDFAGEEKNVADKVEQLQSAGESGDAAAICDEILSRQLREQIQEAGSSCEQEIDKALDDADGFELDVEDVTISGTEATARVSGSDDGERGVREFEFVREGTDWRATSLGT